MLSPRSRGKGGRRVPWRDGGRGKRKVAEWRKQATHAVDDLASLSGSVVEVPYVGQHGRAPGQAIYRFDQRVARAGIRYHAELRSSRFEASFVIRVAAEHAAAVRAIIAQLRNGTRR